MGHDITDAIAGLTDRVFAYRIARIIKRGTIMPLELKGIKGKAIKAAANIDRLNSAYDAFNTAAPAHAADVEGLTPQIVGMQEDLEFSAQLLGNSVADSKTGVEKAKDGTEKQEVKAEEVGTVNAEAIVAPPEAPAIQQPGSTASTEPGA